MVTVEISERNWRRLNRRKDPNQSFDAVVGELLDQDDRDEEVDRHD